MRGIWWLYFQLRRKEFVIRSLDGDPIRTKYFKLIDIRNAGGRTLGHHHNTGLYMRTLIPVTTKAASEIVRNVL
jgi:hypothetical protein